MDGRCLTSARFSPQMVQVALVITPVLTFISGQVSSRFWELLRGVADAFEVCGLCKRDTSCWGLACPPPVCSVFFFAPPLLAPNLFQAFAEQALCLLLNPRGYVIAKEGVSPRRAAYTNARDREQQAGAVRASTSKSSSAHLSELLSID